MSTLINKMTLEQSQWLLEPVKRAQQPLVLHINLPATRIYIRPLELPPKEPVEIPQ